MADDDTTTHTRPIFTFAAIQLLIGLVAIAPMLVSVLAGKLGAALGCRIDESGVHPCTLWGIDIGEPLYTAGVFGWLILASLPTGVVLWIAHTLYTLVRLVRWQRRRQSPRA